MQVTQDLDRGGMPLNPSELRRHGVALISQRRHQDALAVFESVLALEPDDTDALNNRGCMLLEMRRHREALESFDRALSLRVDFAGAWRNRATALAALGDRTQALASLDRALGLRTDFIDALVDRGRMLVSLGRYAEALASLDQALKLDPTLAGALNDHGDVLTILGRFEEALESFERALEIKPDFVLALHNRGSVLASLQRYDDALRCLDDALKVKPDFVEALDNRGMALEALHRFDEALKSYDDALKIRPEFASAHWNEGICRLKLGDFPLGWIKYEWRWLVERLGSPRRLLPQPLWMGKPDLRGKTILLHAEQGLGDTIQFVRYAPLLAAKGANVVLEVSAALAALMQGVAGVNRVLIRGEPPPPVDFHCPLLSLPLAFDTTLETIPANVPYIAAAPERIGRWSNRIPAREGIRVGIVWSGSATHKNDRHRSIPLARLAPLLSVPGVQFVSLQKEVRAEDVAAIKQANPFDVSADLGDFGDTAAAISLLDLVISVDTSVAHLAGALGKPVWILLPYSADWRWLVDREDSPWYPSAKLFRESKSGDWDSVIGNVRNELVKLAKSAWPKDGPGWKGLGAKLIAEQRFLGALSALERALELDPADHQAHNDLGNVLCEVGRFSLAESSYRRALQLKPDYCEAYSNLGTALRAVGRLTEAEVLHRRALALNPAYHAAHVNLANVLRDLGRISEAETSYRHVVELAPQDSAAHNNLGNVLCKLGRFAEAEASYRHAMLLKSDDPGALCGLGAALQNQGKFSEAESCYREALKLNPDYYVAYVNLGNVLRDLGRLPEAEASLRRALELEPDFDNAHNVLGAVYLNLGRASDAEACFRRALQLNPDNIEVYNNLANAVGDLGRMKETEANYRRALEIKPDSPMIYSNLLFLLSYFGVGTTEQYLAQARTWEIATVPDKVRAAASVQFFSRKDRARRKLRIGYLSGDFRLHAVSCFIERILESHDRSRMEIFAYATTGIRDQVTERIQRNVDHWHMIAGSSDDDAVKLISMHQIDVLIDLSGHTAHNRLGIFARRAAPVQCQYLGYFASTGLSEMDYFIADSVLVPEVHDGQYCERVWRLSRVWLSYATPEEAPTPVLHSDPEGRVWLGSFNHLGKLTERTVALWAKLLQRIPGANLLLKTKELDDPGNRSRINAAFGQYGIPQSRIELLGRTADWTAHMSLYNRLDIALDPVGGHGGATTTCDALWMGVPVVTLAGARYGERMSHSILAAIGRSEWSAVDEADYVEKVARLAADSAARKELRLSQRDHIRRSPLSDAAGLARALEDAYESMFDRWVARQSSAAS